MHRDFHSRLYVVDRTNRNERVNRKKKYVLVEDSLPLANRIGLVGGK